MKQNSPVPVKLGVIIAIIAMFAELAAAQPQLRKQVRPTEYNVIFFGASSNAAPSANAAAIQAALDAAAKAGGGRVIVPAGVFRTGTIRLRSHVELHLEQGAVLLASENPADYNPPDEYPENFASASEQWTAEHLIIANRVEDVSLTGPGIIDGNAESFYGEPVFKFNYGWRYGFRKSKDLKRLRPGQLIVFILSKDIRVRDLFVRNASCWSLFFHGCEDVIVSGYRVRNGAADANTDGIDIDSCSNVTVSNCIIETGDDSIAIRGSNARLPHRKACENITISNCVLAASAGGVRIGVGTGTIRNVELGNCIFRRASAGVIIQSSYTQGQKKGVDISYVTIHHSQFLDCAKAFRIAPCDQDAVSEIRDITFDSCRFEAFLDGTILNSGKLRPKNIEFRDCSFRKLANPNPSKFISCQNTLRIEGADNVVFRRCRFIDAAKEGAFISNDVPGLKKEDCNF